LVKLLIRLVLANIATNKIKNNTMSKINKFTFFTKNQQPEEESERIKALESRKKEEKDKRENMVLEDLRQANTQASGKTEQYDKGKMMALIIISSIIKFCIIAIMCTSIIVIFINIVPKIIAFVGQLIKLILF
jgi:hypothetical protein